MESNVPAHQTVVQLPDGTHAYIDPHALAQTSPQIVHQHIHQAAPDRTVQRLALGAGMGGGSLAAGVYFGPLLVGALSAMAVTLAITALCLAVTCWAIVTVVRAVGGPDGQAAAKTLRGRKGRS